MFQRERLGQGQARRGRRADARRQNCGLSVFGEQIDAGERQVGHIGVEHARGNLARFCDRLGLPCLGRQRLRRLQPALAEHACVVSVTVTSTPPTWPLSSRIGL